MTQPLERPARQRILLGVLGLAAAYFVSGRLALLLAIPPGYATAVWPPAGVALAALLVYGARIWPGILLGSFCVNIGTSFDGSSTAAIVSSLAVAAGIGLGASLQALLATRLIRRFVSQPLELVREGDILRFLLLGGPICCLVNATVSVGLLMLSGALGGTQDFLFNWWTWWIGDTIGVALLAPLTLVLIGTPQGIWRRRRQTVALPLAIMIAVVVAVFVRASMWEQSRATSEFTAHSKALAGQVERTLRASEEVLRGVESLYLAVPEVDGARFRAFVSPFFARHPGILAISWNAVVTRRDRAALERAMRTEGFEGFRITETNARGEIVGAGDHDEYVCVRYIEPLEQNRTALGFNVASESVRADALQRAARSGMPATTAPVRLVQDRRERAGLLLCLPAYAEGIDPMAAGAPRRILGFITAAFVIEDVIGAALHEVEHTGITVTVRDDLAPASSSLLYADSSPNGEQPDPRALSYSSGLAFGGRRWSIECRTLPVYRILAGSWRLWATLAAGLFLAAILGAFLLVTTGRAVIIERIGALRMAELSRANETLEREIAERRAVESALLKTEDELRHAQKMEAVGRLAGGVAHGFNNLLTPILGYTEMLRQRIPANDPASPFVTQISQAATRAADLTRQLLVFGRKHIVQPQVIDLTVILGRMHEMLGGIIRENITLRCVPQIGLWRLRTDPGEIEQIIMNLVVNACDAMPRGGRLTIEASNVILDHEFARRHETITPGDHVVLAVSDSGTGMNADVRAHLFEPFFTTKETGKGTGLGLSTVYAIVQQNRGCITVDSEVEKGTTFLIYLPRTREEQAKAPDAETRAGSMRGSETVLVVEDDTGVRNLTCTILRNHGYAVHEASDGEQALTMLKSREVSVQLVLSDVVMPKMGGLDLARSMEVLKPRPLVLYMSGYPEGAASANRLIEEDSWFLHKPFTPRALLEKVRQRLDCGLNPDGRSRPSAA